MESGQHSYGCRAMFVRAQSMANESRRAAYVIYDRNDHSYYAQTDMGPHDTEDYGIRLIATVQPRVTVSDTRREPPKGG